MKKIILMLFISALAISVMAQSKTIKLAGSTTVLPLAQIWAEAYMDGNPKVNISVSGGGSGTGLSMVLNGSCDIAMASRAAKKKEIDTARQKNAKLVATKIALDGLAVVVNKSNSIKQISIPELASVYAGKVKDWDSFNGKGNIVLVGRDSSSGTYGSFQELVLDGSNYSQNMMSQPSNQAIIDMVGKTKTAIGYVGHAYAVEAEKKGKIKILAIAEKKNGTYIVPDDAKVKNGSYPLSRALYFYTIGSPRGDAKTFINWCVNGGQKYVDKAGYVSIK